MDHKQYEIAARSAIKSLLEVPEGEDSVLLFVEHHLEEVEADYFSKIYGTSTPEISQILDSLVFVGSWSSGDDGNIDVYDFSLPEEVTDYLLSVRFTGDEVEEVSMES